MAHSGDAKGGVPNGYAELATFKYSAGSRSKADMQYIIRNMAAHEAPDGDIGNSASRKHNASSTRSGRGEKSHAGWNQGW